MGSQLGLRIRVATPRDIPGILECLRRSFEPYRTEYTPDAFLDTVLTPESARERLRSMTVLVAVDRSNAILGTIAWMAVSPSEAHLRGLAVAPPHHGEGVGASLLAGALNQIRQAGHRRVTLDTTTPLEVARRFYERAGFRPSGKVSDFFGMPLIEYFLELDPQRPHE
jgi:predicted N-acetyltransferase YhbS